MAEDTVHDDNYYIELGKQAAAQKANEVPAPTEDPKPLTFGPMAPVGLMKPTSAPPTDAEKEDALIARILAAVKQAGGSGQPPVPAPTPPTKPISKEDQRVLDVMSRLYPAGRDTEVISRVSLAANLFLVEMAYTPYSGVRHTSEALLFDDGKRLVIFRAD